MPTKTLRAEPITRRDIVRLVDVGGSTESEEPRADRRPTVRPPSMQPAAEAPPSRQSTVRLKGTADADRLPFALVDIVTADFSRDPRHDDD